MALFMSEAERKRDNRRRRRRAVREVENAVDAARLKADTMRQKRESEWVAARDALDKGDEAEARRRLKTVAMTDAARQRLDQRLQRFEELAARMAMADADAAFDETAAALARLTGEKGEAPQEPLRATQDGDGEVAAVSVDDLLARLREEVSLAGETRGGGPKTPPAAAALKVDAEASAQTKWTTSRPDHVRLADVVGLEEAKALVTDALINPVKHPDIYETLRVKPGTGLLLYGPPGTGKTLFAKALANELDLPFMEVRCDKLKSKYVGETEKNVAEMFAAARALGRCVLFLDECNAILSRRGDQKVCMVEQFLVELDGFAASASQLFVLMATNLPWTLDSAVTRSGRLSEAVYVGLPDLAARRKLLELALRDTPLAGDVDLDALAAKTEGYSGADLAAKGGVCHRAKTLAVRRWVARRDASQGSGAPADDTPERVTAADFEAAIAAVTSVSRSAADLVKRNQEWKKDA